MGKQLAEALSFIHDNEICHNDLNYKNVLVKQQNPNIHLVILRFNKIFKNFKISYCKNTKTVVSLEKIFSLGYI